MREGLGRVRQRVGDVLMERSPAERTQLVVVLFIVVLYLAHYLVFCWPQPFYIEDSAISFAYARHLVEGEGLVTYPGGERVEGYSNALWTFLLAGWMLVGVSPWWSSKIMGAALGVATLVLVWRIARRARPEATGVAAIVAPLLLAASSQFVIWNGSGLENSLFHVLLAAGIWSLTREIQDGRRSTWSALAFFGLTMTRPDGVMYAALGLFGRLLGTVARRQWSALPLWILTFAVPYGLYNAWRYDYFAWWFPNTYYAKEKDFRPLNWASGGWKQIRDYVTQYGVVYAAPLVVIALTGLSSWRRWIGLVVLVFFALFTLWDGRTGIPVSWTGDGSRTLARHWSDARIWFLLGGSVTLGLVSFGRKGWEARGLLWGALCGGIFFVVATGADWMKGFRWFSLTSVPLFTLLGVGIGALAERLPWSGKAVAGWLPARALWATPIVVALAYPNVNGSYTFAMNPETSPRDVNKRVKYMSWVQRRLGLDQATLLDVDMGAHMWWSGWDIVDIAGLVDVPMARHKKYNRAFIAEYIFEERKPDFAHVHGSWARTSKIHLAERWDDDYVEIPGYPTSKRSLHVGNHVRKEHLVGRSPVAEGRRVVFADGVMLDGWAVPSPEVAPGGKLYVASTWRATEREDGFRVLAFLADAEGVKHVAEVVPGYDWYKPEEWRAREYVYGNWSIALPEKLATGTYDVGFVLLDEKTGAVLPWLGEGAAPEVAGAPENAGTADAPATGATGAAGAPPATGALATAATEGPPPRFMRGEWVHPQAVTVIPFNDAVAAADADFAAAMRQAANGECEAAAETFRNARRHIARNDRWFLEHVGELTTARVSCYVARAEPVADPLAKARILAEGRKLDHRHEGLVAVSRPLAAALFEQGEVARAAEDWEGAYRAYAAALSIDARLSWARRWAEEARDKRLGIDPEKADPVVPRKTTPAQRKASPATTVGKAADRAKAPMRVDALAADEAEPAEAPAGDEAGDGPDAEPGDEGED